MDSQAIFEYGINLSKLQAPPLSHRDDPLTSYDAAEKMIASGKLKRELKMIVRLIIDSGRKDFTALELAGGVRDQNYYVIQKRLSVLERKDLIVHTKEVRQGHLAWRLV